MKLPRYAVPLFQPSRYKVLYGGRGSAKSHTIGGILLAKGSEKKLRVLCGREFQNSISESVHKVLTEIISRDKLTGFFITNTHIRHNSGTEFIFKGMRNNIDSIKSMEAIDILWIEEADKISQYTWDIIVPTIRKEGSEIWISFNPDSETDPIYDIFVANTPPQNAIVMKVSWRDNPWFPEVLRLEKEHMERTNPDKADWIWEGNVRKNSKAQIFNGKWSIDKFEIQPHFDGPYFGADWGYSQDPSALTKLYIDTEMNYLYIRYAKFGVTVGIKQLPTFFDSVPESRDFKIRADNSRPETINYMITEGFDIVGAPKWKGSVEDGIEFLRSFDKIILHPDCDQEMIDEFKLYSYKVDRLTGDILKEIVDKNNHGHDANRYALAPLIQQTMSGSFSETMKQSKRKSIKSKIKY